MRYLLDTNILLHAVRGSGTWEYVDISFEPFRASENQTFVSFASIGELLSIATQLGWGKAKMAKLVKLLESLPVVAPKGGLGDELTQAYAQIDAFSQGKLSVLPLPKGASARNMGKNDLWIAATAHALKAKLLTTDHDFDHLNGVFCEVVVIAQIK